MPAPASASPPPETIAFDLGGVLLTDGSKTAWARIEEALGIPAAATYELWEGQFRVPLNTGQADEADLWEAIAALDPRVSPLEPRQIFLDGYQAIPHGISGLRKARELGWQTALATDNVNAWLDYWRQRHPWFGLLDVVCCSADLGVLKPDRVFFESLVELTGDRRAYFIDDRPANVAAATAVGLRGIVADENGWWAYPFVETNE